MSQRATTAVPPAGHAVPRASAPARVTTWRLRERMRLSDVWSVGLLFPVLCLAIVIGLWAGSLETIDVREITDLGLVSVLPSSLPLAAVILALSFCVSLRLWPRSDLVPGAHVLALLLLLYATPILIEEIPRFHVTWRHVGIVDFIARTGEVDPTLDVYSNWPGFFLLAAFLWNAAGVNDFLAIAEWSPLYLNVLYLGPLLLLFRSFTDDRRAVWLGVWFFYIADWIGQDYFSPQGSSFFLYLSVFALVAAYIRRQSNGANEIDGLAHGGSRAALIGLIIVLTAASAPTHQLTPVQIVISLAVVVALHRGRLAGLLVVSAVLVVAWIVYVAWPFLDGHLAAAIEDVGQVGSTVDANVGERIRGSADHLLVLRTRLLMTSAVWGLALLGFIRLWRTKGQPSHRLAIALALSPFLLLGLQSYGGEMLLRVYLFSLPFMAFLAASLFYPTVSSGTRWLVTPIVFAISVGLIASFAVARYGNERADTFTREEVVAVEHLYSVAAPGSTLVAADENLPWKSRSYERHSHIVAANIAGWDEGIRRRNGRFLANRVAEYMAKARDRSYLIITRSQKAGVDVLGTAPRGSLKRFEQGVLRSKKFKVIYSNRDARILMLRNAKAPNPKTERAAR